MHKRLLQLPSKWDNGVTYHLRFSAFFSIGFSNYKVDTYTSSPVKFYLLHFSSSISSSPCLIHRHHLLATYQLPTQPNFISRCILPCVSDLTKLSHTTIIFLWLFTMWKLPSSKAMSWCFTQDIQMYTYIHTNHSCL